jgi:hypothetical protein
MLRRASIVFGHTILMKEPLRAHLVEQCGEGATVYTLFIETLN